MSSEAREVTPWKERDPMHDTGASLFLTAEPNECSPPSEGGKQSS
jgi:hypothetical protein